MESLDISLFDVGDFDVLDSSVQKFLDDAINCDYFDLDIYDTTDQTSDLSLLDKDEQPQRKRKVSLTELQQQYKLSRPRIVKSDFRRNFAQMWVGVFNSTDYGAMMSHIRSFYNSDVTLYQNDLRKKNIPIAGGAVYKNKNREPVVGQEYLSSLWYRSMQIAPDQVCVLKHTFVKVRSDGTSSVKITFGIEGTKVLKVENVLASAEPYDATERVQHVKNDVFHDPTRAHTATMQRSGSSSPDDLDRFVSSDSTDSADSTSSFLSSDSLIPEESVAGTVEAVDPLQTVLQRYLQASDAVIRSKHKEGTRKRRRRVKHVDPRVPIAVEEWLAQPAPEVMSVTKDENRGRVRPIRLVQCARIVGNIAYVDRVDSDTDSDTEKEPPQVHAYDVKHHKGEVMLTTPWKKSYSLEFNFDANRRIVSVHICHI